MADELDPDPPVITAVQVDYNVQEAVIEWLPSDADDLAGYIIYLCNGGFQMAIDTIFDPNATSYMHMASNVQSYIESYNIAAFDSCFVNGEPDPGAASNYCATSLFLNVSTQACSDAAQVNWSGAYNIDSEIVSYHIWVDEETPTGSGNWSGPQEIGTTDANANSWQHQGATFGSTYRYHIEAVTASGISILSNRDEVEFSYPGAPAYTSIRRASVAGTDTVQVLVDLDPNSNDVHSYTLQRKRS
ncbi:MAG: fibronectin type III domain-containing protein, partial [Flavobacteriales bacterium]